MKAPTSRAKLRFDRRVRLEFHGATITSDAGLLACRELDDALGLTETTNECLQESRGGRNVQHRLVGLLRQSVYSRLAGYEDTNDAERLAQDPTMRVVVGRRGGPERPAASTNTMSRFETEVLTQDGNVEGLGRLNAKWVDGAMSRTPHRRVILDMDSSESPVHGEQEGASYNGHFGSTCYHPLFVFNQFGDCEGAMLRAGNVHSAHRWRDVLDPILSRYGETGLRRYFRADAAFAKPDIYEYLEERHVLYAIRLPGNEVLQREIAPLLRRPVGRPPKRPVILYDDFWYRAGSWDRARRVVAKVEWHRGELFPRVGFIVTSMTAGPEGVVRFYNGRGTAEQWIKEGKYALNWTRLSCHRFVANRDDDRVRHGGRRRAHGEDRERRFRHLHRRVQRTLRPGWLPEEPAAHQLGEPDALCQPRVRHADRGWRQCHRSEGEGEDLPGDRGDPDAGHAPCPRPT